MAHGVACAVLHRLLGAPELQFVQSAYVSGALDVSWVPSGPLRTHHGGLAITGISRVCAVAEHLRLRRVVGGVESKWSRWCPGSAVFRWMGGLVVMSVGPRNHVVAGGVWQRCC